MTADRLATIRARLEAGFRNRQHDTALMILDVEWLLARIQRLEEVARAAQVVAIYNGAEPEPCWRCGGGGSHCEERLGELVTCRCCGGSGEHCQLKVGKSGHDIACVKHNPKQRPDECEMEPELAAALRAALEDSEPEEAFREMSCDVEDTCVCRSDKACFDPSCRTCPMCAPTDFDTDDYDEGDPDERSCWTCGGDGYHECEEWDCLHPKPSGYTHLAPCPNCRGSGDAKDVWCW